MYPWVNTHNVCDYNSRSLVFTQYDGYICFSCDGEKTPRQVLEICAHFGGLQAARTEMMGLFVYDLGPIDEEKVTTYIIFY